MPALYGRTDLVDRLRSCRDTAAGGRRSVVLLRAPAGMGKSALLHAAIADGREQGWTCVVGGITEPETQLSWSGLATLVRSIPDEAIDELPHAPRAALLAAVAGTGAGADALEVAVAFAQVVRRLAGRGPVLVVIDDLHWFDRASAGAVSHALREWEDAPVAVVLAGRGDDAPPVIDVDRIVGPDGYEPVDPPGLSLADIGTLIGERTGHRLGRPDLLRVQAVTGGNPLHVIETARLLAAGHPLDRALLPASVQAAVAGGLDALPAEALVVLGAAALLAVPRVDVLERLFPPADVEAALIAAERLDAVRVEGQAVVLRHPVVQAALVERLGGLERRGLHRRLAEVLDDPEQRAVHLGAAAAGSDEPAAAALEDAADRAAARGATHLGVERARRAVELTHPDRRSDLHRRLCRVGWWALDAGDLVLAEQAYRDALALGGDDAERVRALRGAMAAVANLHGFEAAVPVAEELYAAARHDPELRVMAATRLTRVLHFVDVGRASAFAAEVLASAGVESVDGYDELVALGATSSFLAGEPVDIEALRRRWVGQGGVADAREVPYAWGELLVWSDLFDEADDYHRRRLQAVEEAGQLVAMINPLTQLADAAFRAGRWDEMHAWLERRRELSATMGHRGETSVHPDVALVRAVRGDVAGAREALEKALADDVLLLDEAQLACRAGAVALLDGEPGLAVDLLERGRSCFERVALSDLCAFVWWSDLVEALTAAGRSSDAAEVVAQMRAAAARSGRPRAAAEVARAEAILAAVEGSLDEAEGAVQRALDLHPPGALPFDEARVLLLAGTVARRSGRRTVARERLERARELFAGLDARVYVARTDAELARVQGRSGRNDALTETELQVAGLVAQGRTNAEVAAELFVSVRTVEANLTRLYRKLGVRSRTELARHPALQAPVSGDPAGGAAGAAR